MLSVIGSAVGAVGTPEKLGDIFCACTNSVVAKNVLLSAASLVGAVGVPKNCGPEDTNAVVANCVLDVPAEAVGAVGTPKNCGL